jgi:GAF domain-containing protein
MDGYERLGQVFVELADTLVDDFDPLDFLQTLTERSVELLGADAAGLMLADERGALQLVASTMEQARDLEVFELQVHEGPCLDCFASGRAVVNVDLTEAYERWPTFTRAAVEAGFRATHALPLRLRHQVVGAMNLFTAEHSRIDAAHVAIGQAMADVATIGLLHERNLREQTALSEQLQAALHSRVLIEQAKGVLAARAGIGVAEAFVRMRSYARRSGLALTAVATAVVDGSVDNRILAVSE